MGIVSITHTKDTLGSLTQGFFYVGRHVTIFGCFRHGLEGDQDPQRVRYGALESYVAEALMGELPLSADEHRRTAN